MYSHKDKSFWLALSIKFAKDMANQHGTASTILCEQFRKGETVQLERELSPSHP